MRGLVIIIFCFSVLVASCDNRICNNAIIGDGLKLGNVFFRLEGEIKEINIKSGIDVMYFSFKSDSCDGILVHGTFSSNLLSNINLDSASKLKDGIYRFADGRYMILGQWLNEKDLVASTEILIKSSDHICATKWIEKSMSLFKPQFR